MDWKAPIVHHLFGAGAIRKFVRNATAPMVLLLTQTQCIVSSRVSDWISTFPREFPSVVFSKLDVTTCTDEEVRWLYEIFGTLRRFPCLVFFHPRATASVLNLVGNLTIDAILDWIRVNLHQAVDAPSKEQQSTSPQRSPSENINLNELAEIIASSLDRHKQPDMSPAWMTFEHLGLVLDEMQISLAEEQQHSLLGLIQAHEMATIPVTSSVASKGASEGTPPTLDVLDDRLESKSPDGEPRPLLIPILSNPREQTHVFSSTNSFESQPLQQVVSISTPDHSMTFGRRNTINPEDHRDPEQSLRSRSSAGDRTLLRGFSALTLLSSHEVLRSPTLTFKSGAAAGVSQWNEVLCNVPHLCTLSADQLRRVHVIRREYDPLDSILAAGMPVQHIYVIVSGSVEAFVEEDGMRKRVGSMRPPQLFAVEANLFDTPSTFTYCAGQRDTVLLLIGRKQFLELVAESHALRQSIARKVVDHMEVFDVFRDFCRAVVVPSALEHTSKVYLNMNPITTAYRKMRSVIHPKLDSCEIDYEAWQYAVRRLPDNITTTFVFELARSLPPFLSSELRDTVERGATESSKDNVVSFVMTRDRRRCSWQIGERGKTLVLLREGYSDLLDFITNFMIHVHEAQKLRNRLQCMVRPSAIDLLHKFGSSSVTTKECPTVQASVLDQLPLSPNERAGIREIWPTDTLHRLYDVVMHREEYLIRLDSSMGKRFDIDPYYQWAHSIREHVLDSIGQPSSAELPSSLTIDILSSNTHSVKNCLGSYARQNRDAILQWGKENARSVMELQWGNEDDMLYCILSSYLSDRDNDPLGTRRQGFYESLGESGFRIIEDTAMTGLQVDVINVNVLLRKNGSTFFPDRNLDEAKLAAIKSIAQAESEGRQRVILNMDYAFGAQADRIIRALILTFGRCIRSINVIGKAGALEGNRGDIILPTHVVFSKSGLVTQDNTDEMRHCGNHDLQKARLEHLLTSWRSVLTGPVLTIPGTVMQNEMLLKYYKMLWGCVGVEMEGSYFARQIEESIALGLLPPSLKTRFCYYVADMPLRKPPLTRSLQPNEGIPPLYAITRAMLELILS